MFRTVFRPLKKCQKMSHGWVLRAASALFMWMNKYPIILLQPCHPQILTKMIIRCSLKVGKRNYNREMLFSLSIFIAIYSVLKVLSMRFIKTARNVWSNLSILYDSKHLWASVTYMNWHFIVLNFFYYMVNQISIMDSHVLLPYQNTSCLLWQVYICKPSLNEPFMIIWCIVRIDNKWLFNRGYVYYKFFHQWQIFWYPCRVDN